MTTIDRLVRDYLQTVERAAADLPDARRRELVGDLGEHIAAERAALDDPTEADIRAILDRLGDPTTLAAEARALDDEPRAASPAPPRGRGMGPVGWVLTIVGSVVVLCVGLVVLGAAAFLIAAPTGTGTGTSVPVPVPVESGLPSPPR